MTTFSAERGSPCRFQGRTQPRLAQQLHKDNQCSTIIIGSAEGVSAAAQQQEPALVHTQSNARHHTEQLNAIGGGVERLLTLSRGLQDLRHGALRDGLGHLRHGNRDILQRRC